MDDFELAANFWRGPIRYRLYRIDTKLGRNSTPDPALMKSPNR
jgi:hypothetical protein